MLCHNMIILRPRFSEHNSVEKEPEKAIFYVAPWRCDDWWFLLGENIIFSGCFRDLSKV